MASELKWNEVDPASLPKDVAERYARYKEAYARMKEARQEFEAGLNEFAKEKGITGEETELAVAYNYGKLSVAIAPKRERKASKRAVALGEIA